MSVLLGHFSRPDPGTHHTCVLKPPTKDFTESQNVRGWKGPLWVI